MKREECEIIELPKIVDLRGNLSFIEQYKQIPFEIKRVHWIYDVPGGVERGGLLIGIRRSISLLSLAVSMLK
jgi:hypothetical protein